MLFRGFFNKEGTKITLYIILRLLVILTMVRQFFLGNWNNFFLCILTLILFLIPSILEKQLKINLPDALEGTIYLFIFAAEILGEINNFYGTFPYWDTMLHTLNGFLAAAIGFSLIDILNRHDKFHISLSPLFVAIVAFSFSMTIGVLWEFFEFAMDQWFQLDMQKDRILQSISTVTLHPEGKNIPVIVDNIYQTIIYSTSEGETVETVIENGYLDIGLIDTMKDMLVNFVGAFVFSLFGWLYIKNRDKYQFAKYFIPVLENQTKDIKKT